MPDLIDYDFTEARRADVEDADGNQGRDVNPEWRLGFPMALKAS